MTRYRLPDVLGGAEMKQHTRPDGSTEGPAGTVAFLVDGCIVSIARGLLTAVDTTPAEPEPGAWLIGEVLAVRFRDSGGGNRNWVYGNRGIGYDDAGQWASVWGDLGGPGITPRRLVPAPAAVELPWHHRDREGFGAWVNESPRSWAAARVSAPWDNNSADLTPEAAEEMAAALLTAAWAAREVAP